MRRTAQQYLDPLKMAVVVGGDKTLIVEQIQPYGDVITKNESRISSQAMPLPTLSLRGP